jgi:curved DNA-binding protein CbpA
MDVITVDGKQYDPYFILDVVREDTDKHISKSFREKVKKYHPDKYTDKDKKKKYEQYFKILSESYRYIQDKRSNSGDLQQKYKNRKSETTNDQSHVTKNKKNIKKTKKDFEELNENYDKKIKSLNPNDFGYGDDYKRMEKIEDYEKENLNICKQFGKKKFSLTEFNKMFEYNRRNEDQDNITSKALIHKTTDGFSGYNSADFGSSALVSSFNGLLITGDDLGERGVGYWGGNYSDYKYSYKRGTKNPDRRIQVPKDFVPESQRKKFDENLDKKYSEYKCNYHKNSYKKQSNFKNEQDILYEKTYNELLEKEQYDKNIVMKYIDQYDEQTVRMAMSGELDQTPTYTSTLKKYITEK